MFPKAPTVPKLVNTKPHFCNSVEHPTDHEVLKFERVKLHGSNCPAIEHPGRLPGCSGKRSDSSG